MPGKTQNSPMVPHSFPSVPENPAWLKQVRQNRTVECDTYARSHGLTPAEYEQRVSDHLKQLLIEAKAFHRIADESALKNILTVGRFKSQFETNKSGGLLDNSLRGVTESAIFGYPSSLDREKRPIYGYLYHNENGMPVHEDMEDYGNITARLKPDVLRRSSFTSGDSLEVTGGGAIPSLAPKPVDAPGWEALNDWTGDALTFRSLRDWVNHTLAKDGIKYIEAHIHHKLSAREIEEVFFHAAEPDADLKALLSKYGIPWKMVQ